MAKKCAGILRANGNRLPDSSRSPCCGWPRWGMRFGTGSRRMATCCVRTCDTLVARFVARPDLRRPWCWWRRWESARRPRSLRWRTMCWCVPCRICIPSGWFVCGRRDRGYPQMELSPPNYLDWKATATSFEAMAAYAPWSTSMVGQGEPIQVDGAQLAEDLLPMLGVAPAMGRWFTVDEERSAAPGVVILSYGLWESRFGGRMDAIGEKILLDGDPHTIIGIMPPEFSFPQRRAQVWPLRFRPSDLANRNNNYLSAIARRKPGVSLEQARQEMRLISARLATQYPKENSALSATVGESARPGVFAVPDAGDGTPGGFGVRFADCVHQPGESAAGAGSLPAEGTGRSGFSGSGTGGS